MAEVEKEEYQQQQDKKSKNKSDDLLELNEQKQQETEQIEIDNEAIEKIERDFNLDSYAGFQTDKWVKYLGSINDVRSKRHAALASLDKWNVMFNTSNDIYLPKFEIIQLEYHSVTKAAWDKRRSDLAEIEDMQRDAGVINLQLAEYQNAIRERTLSQGQGNRKVENLAIEDINDRIGKLDQIERGISKKVADKITDSDMKAFRMYFHKTEEDYGNIQSDHMSDIIGACDWKQNQGPKNLQHLRTSPILATQGVS